MSPETEALDGRALTLGTGPEGVQTARRWVVDALRHIGRHELMETAELGVSELVTNAVLHADPPIRVALGGTRDHPRIEVADCSTDLPEPPSPTTPDDLDALLTTIGRGLGIVSRASLAWGTEIRDGGKVVWFVPAHEVAADMSEAVVTGSAPEQAVVPGEELVEVTLESLPVTELAEFRRHYNELRREVRLLALAHETQYPVAKTLSDHFVILERALRRGASRSPQLDDALVRRADAMDVELVVPADRIPEIERLVDLLDLADEFCREARLLALARSERQRDFQTWFLREVARRATGEPGIPWAGSTAPDDGR